LRDWLLEHLPRWEGPALHGGWVEVLYWLFIVWGGLAVLAVLVHLGWTLATLFGERSSRGGPLIGQLHADGQRAVSADELHLGARRAADRGEFAQAVALLMAALLTMLADRKVLRAHPSKTNGEYLREYPAAAAGQDAFGRFVRQFDRVVYGQAPCDRQTFDAFGDLFERIRTDERQQS
jgi:hypothetical protein